MPADWKARCREYVTGRQSKDGGFCFYASDYVEESNLYDTGFALATLRILETAPPRRNDLESWLADQRRRLCEESSLSALWSYVRSARLLDIDPGEEIDVAIERNLSGFLLPSREEMAEWDAGDLLRDLCRLVALTAWRKRPPPAAWRRKVSGLLQVLRGESGAFPRNRENPVDSWRAFTIARTLRIPIEKRPLVDLACRRLAPAGPALSLSTESESLEAVCCGLRILAAFSRPIEERRKESLAVQIEACQSASGGFGRRIGAIPTLEDSYHGAKSLALLG